MARADRAAAYSVGEIVTFRGKEGRVVDARKVAYYK